MKKVVVMILFLFIFINLKEARASTPYRKINKNVFKEVIQSLTVLGDWDKTIMRIAMYAKYKFNYQSDESLFGKIDYWQSAEEMFYNQAGDCDDYTGFFQGALRLAGIPVAGYVVWSRAPKLFCHAIVAAPFKGGWATLDSSREILHSGYSSEAKAVDGIVEKYGYEVGGNIPVDYPDYHYQNNKPALFKNASRLKMHAHLTECALNQIELLIPNINNEKNYCELENKEAVGILVTIRRKNFLYLKAIGLSFSMHGWYSPNIEYNNKIYTAHFLWSRVGVNIYTGDYEGLDIDVNPISLNWLKTYIACRNFGEVWDYKGVLSPFKFIDAVAEINDGNLSYGAFLNFFEEKDSFVSAGYNNEKEVSLAVNLLNPNREIKMSIGSHFRIEISFGW